MAGRSGQEFRSNDGFPVSFRIPDSQDRRPQAVAELGFRAQAWSPGARIAMGSRRSGSEKRANLQSLRRNGSVGVLPSHFQPDDERRGSMNPSAPGTSTARHIPV